MFELLLLLICLPIWAVPAFFTGGYWFKHSINKIRAECVLPGQQPTNTEISDAQLTSFVMGFLWPLGIAIILLRGPAMQAIKVGAKVADKQDVELIKLTNPHYREALEEIHKEFPSLDAGYIEPEYYERDKLRYNMSNRWG